jgi:hypothetical protein
MSRQQQTLGGEVVEDPGSEDTPAEEPAPMPSIETPVCCIEGCETEVPGLGDGCEASSRDGVACNDCWAFHDRHGHWPDEEPDTEFCAECCIDEGAVRHDCPEFGDIGDVILDPGSECRHCGAVVSEED